MTEKELTLIVKDELEEATEDLKNQVKDFIHVEIFKPFDNSLSFDKLQSECNKFNIFVDKASNNPYYKKQIKNNKFKDCWLFHFAD